MISVIVPVYKAERTISRCIDSIIAQNYQDWELILVDDGSPDVSGRICDEYANRDLRIRVIHQTNKGVSAARNIGISVSYGNYICFVDADDCVDSGYISCMVEKCDEGGPELVIQGLRGYDDNGHLVLDERFDTQNILVEKIDDELLFHLVRYRGPYCKLYRASIIKDNNIEFPEDLSYGEDGIFYYKYLLFCKSIIFLNLQGYCYSVNVAGGLSTKCHDPELLWKMYEREYALFSRLHSVFIGASKYTEADWEKLCNIKTLLISLVKYRIGVIRIKDLLSSIANNEDFAFSMVHTSSFRDRVIKTFIMLFKS